MKKTRAQSNLRKRLRNQKNDRKCLSKLFRRTEAGRGIGISLV